MLNTIVRTGEVLELFTRQRPEWGVTEIAQTIGVPKSNAHEIVSSLASIDLLQRTGRSRYRLGWRVMMMANGVVDAHLIRRCAPVIMNTLSQVTGETSHIAVWDGRKIVFIARVLAERGLHTDHTQVGDPMEAHCTASGKVLMAELPSAELARRVREAGLTPRTRRSITEYDELVDELAQVRETGIGINREEADDGYAGIAVPVRSRDGHVVAALAVSMTSDRVDGFLREHESLIRRLARNLADSLGQGDVSSRAAAQRQGVTA